MEKKPKKRLDDKKDESKNLMSDPLALLFIKPIGYIFNGDFKGRYYYLSHY